MGVVLTDSRRCRAELFASLRWPPAQSRTGTRPRNKEIRLLRAAPAKMAGKDNFRFD
jgi:hypothetical protein